MRVQALLPTIHQRPTGGNLFNNQVLAFLEEVATVARQVIREGAPLPVAQRSDAAPEAILVDSLLLVSAAEYLRAAQGLRLLLAHYLHLFEPACRDSAEAQLECRYLPLVDGVVTTSDYCRDLLLKKGFSDRQLVTVTPGLAPGYASPARPRTAASLPPRILTVATILPGKGLRQLLEILESVADLDWTWEVAGDPELEPAFAAAFRRRVEGSALRRRIHLHGAVAPEQMIDLYDRCDLFVLPSRFETCSMATMEAMARGLPVAAYRVGGLPERVPEANRRFLAPSGDAGQLAASLRHLLTDRDLATSLGEGNRRASRAFPSWPESGAQLWSFLRRLPRRLPWHPPA